MIKLNYIIAIILIVLWGISFFNNPTNNSVHFLLIGALTLLLINIIDYDNNHSKKHLNKKQNE